MIKKVLGWIFLSIFGLILLALIYLSITGFPKPPTMTRADNVPRVSWDFVFDNIGNLRKALKSVSFSTWTPDGEQMVVQAHGGGFRFYPHFLGEALGKPVIFENYPKKAQGFKMNPNPEKRHLVFAMDTGGDENSQLYRYDLDKASYVPLTDNTGQNKLGGFNHSGEVFAFTSTQRNGTDRDLYLMNPENPESTELIMELEGWWYAGDWSPTQDSLLIARYISVSETHPYILDIPNRKLIPLIDSLPENEQIAFSEGIWSKDGRKVFFTSDQGTEFQMLRVMDLAKKEERILSSSIPWDIKDLELSSDGKTLGFSANVERQNEWYVMDTESGMVKRFDIPGLAPGLKSAIHFHPEENKIAFNHKSYDGTLAIFTYNLDTEELAPWAKGEANKDDLPLPQLIQYPTFDSVDGQSRLISAWYIAADPNAPGPHPVYIKIHGGPESQAGPAISPGIQSAQKKGISFLIPNVRGSTGYGKSFTKLDNGYLRENSVKDIGALLDWIAAQPELDENRVLVTGGSYGGYMTLACLVHYSDRLIGGVDVVGISHFVTFLENTEDYRRDLRRVEYGDERDPDMRAFLESISPLNHIDQITKPLMIVQGANDPRVPVSESRQMVEKMKDNGLEVWYLEAEDEGHGFRNPWNQFYYSGTEYIFALELFFN